MAENDPSALQMINTKLTSICTQVATLREDMASVKADLIWLKKAFWMLAGVVLASAGGYFLF